MKKTKEIVIESSFGRSRPTHYTRGMFGESSGNQNPNSNPHVIGGVVVLIVAAALLAYIGGTLLGTWKRQREAPTIIEITPVPDRVRST